MLLVPLELRRVLLSMHGCSTAIWQCLEQCNFSTMKLMRALSEPMAEIRVGYSAGLTGFAGERSRGTSTGLNSIIKNRKFKSRSPVLAAEQQTVQSAITITQSCQRTTIHAQQRFVTAAKNHP